MKSISKVPVIARLLLTVTLLCVFATGVSAITYTASPHRAKIRNYDAVYAVLYDAIAAGNKEADIHDYGVPAEDIRYIYSDILASAPEFFYLDNKISYYYQHVGLQNIVTRVQLRYTMTAEEREEARINYEQELSYIFQRSILR